MKNKQKTNWWIDIILFISFLITFFLDITGIFIHQWIGIVSIALATFHLFLHRNWLKAVTRKFFRKRSGKVRSYYIIDGLILVGFLLIGITGLLMSTWLNLPMQNYTTWRHLHITVSIATLALILFKLLIHLRWIVQTTRKILSGPVILQPKTVPVQAANNDEKRIGRRDFLVTMGIVSTASFLALASASKSLAESIAITEAAESITDSSQTTESAENALPITENAETTLQATETTVNNVQPTATMDTAAQTSIRTATQIETPTSTETESDCTVRCRRGCAYPGHCRKYVDSNNNGLCDMGECM